MSAAIQTLELIGSLVKAKIPKQTATKLLDYIETQKAKAVNYNGLLLLFSYSGLLGYSKKHRGCKNRNENRKLLLGLIRK